MIEIDDRAFRSAVARVIDETGRSGGDVLKQQAKLFVRDAIQLTPPTGKAPFSESLNTQKKAGESAIRGDINSIFRSIQSLGVVSSPASPRAKAQVDRMRGSGDASGMEAFLRAIGINAKVVADLTLGLHAQNRSRATGRTLKGRAHQHLVMNSRTIQSVMQSLIRRVGIAKAGWLTAARAFGLSLPSWITRHNSPGQVSIKLSGDTQSIEVVNAVSFAQKMNRKNRIIQRALDRRAESMNNQLNAAMGKVFRGYSSK